MSGALSESSSSDQHVHLTRGASYLIIQSLGLNAAAIVSFVILARLISTKEMGIWAILLLIVAICQALATWFAPAVTKFVAENASKKPEIAAASFYQALRATFVMCLPAVAAIYIGAPFLASRLLGDISYSLLFRVLAFDVFFAGALPTVAAALLGLQMFREAAAVSLVVQGFLRQFLIISLIVLLRNFVGLVIGGLVSDAATLLIYLALTMRNLGAPRFDFPLNRLFRFSLPLELAQIASFAQTWFDRALLVAFVPLATLGIYNAALTAFGVLNGVSIGIANMLFPAYSSIQEEMESRNRMRDAIRLATRYTSLTLTPLAFGLLATSKPALTLFVGESYIGGYLPLAVLSGAFALTAFATALGPVLLALEETELAALITGVTVVIGLAVAYVLLPEWGIVGASAARALTIILGAIITFLIVRRQITLQLDITTIAKHLLAGTIMGVVVVIVQLVEYSKLLLPLYVLIGAIVYVIMLRQLKAVNPADLTLLRSFLGKRLSPVSSILSWIFLSHDSRPTHGSENKTCMCV